MGSLRAITIFLLICFSVQVFNKKKKKLKLENKNNLIVFIFFLYFIFLQSMVDMGNTRAKHLYEAHLPENFRRPQTDQYPSLVVYLCF